MVKRTERYNVCRGQSRSLAFLGRNDTVCRLSLHTGGEVEGFELSSHCGPHSVLTRMLMSNIDQFPFSPSVGTYATFSRLWQSILKPKYGFKDRNG